MLIPTLLLRDFKRVIPPRTGLLRLAHSSPFSRFLVNLSKEGISMKRSIPGHSWRQIRGNKFPRMEWKSDLVQLAHNYIHLSIIRHAWFFYYKHIQLLVLIKILHRHSYNENIHSFAAYEHNYHNTYTSRYQRQNTYQN
jgi:hypothetical protein